MNLGGKTTLETLPSHKSNNVEVWTEKRDRDETLSELHYSLQVVPKIPMPISLLKKQLYQDLPVNLLAISQRVREVFSK